MPEKEVGHVSTLNMCSREEPAGSDILKMIEDLEKDILRIESKIAAICGGHGGDKFREGRHQRNGQYFQAHEVQTHADTELDVKFARPKKEKLTGPAAEKSDKTATERDLLLYTFETELARINMLERKQKREACITTMDDEGEWDMFIKERTGGHLVPSSKANIQTKDVANLDQTDNASDWDMFVKERSGLIVTTTKAPIVEERTVLKDKAKYIVNTHLNDKVPSDKTYDNGDWDDFFKERTGLAVAADKGMGVDQPESNYTLDNDECDP